MVHTQPLPSLSNLTKLTEDPVCTGCTVRTGHDPRAHGVMRLALVKTRARGGEGVILPHFPHAPAVSQPPPSPSGRPRPSLRPKARILLLVDAMDDPGTVLLLLLFNLVLQTLGRSACVAPCRWDPLCLDLV